MQRFSGALMAIGGLALAAAAADTIVYPKKGQSAEQQQKDAFECYGWA